MKLLLLGGYGRMGRCISSLIKKHKIYSLRKIGRGDVLDLSNSDVILDFSTPKANQENLPKIISAQKPLVIGITGFTHEQLSTIQKASQYIPIYLSSNFSQGISLLHAWINNLPQGSYILKETHHKEKRDSPSGTALDLAQRLPTYPKIISYRKGKTVGKHVISYHLPYETLTISHTAHRKEAFAQGALSACLFLYKKSPGLYTSLHA